MRKMLMGIIISLSIASAAYCQTRPLEFNVELDKQVYLFLSQEESVFSPSGPEINITGLDIGGLINIYLNDEKIGILKGGGTARNLQLKKGKNIIKIEGTSKEKIYIMIGIYDPIIENRVTQGYKSGNLLVKEVLTPGQLEEGVFYILNGK